MKIGILADAVDRQQAGVHTYTKEIIRAMLEVDDSNQYVLVKTRITPEFSKATQLISPIYPIPGWASLRLFVQVPNLFNREKVDVVIEPAHFGPFNLPKRIKRVTVIHDLTPLLMPEHHVFHGQMLQRIFLPSILRRTDLIITNSEYTRSDVVKHFPFTEHKTVAIHLAKDSVYRPVTDQEVLDKYDIRQPYFLFVGTLEPRKDLNTLIKAFERFKMEKNSPYQLVVTGGKGWKSGPFFKALEKHPFRKDILITGYVEKEDLPVLYSMAEAFVYPSLYEGFGLPVLESMACGTPCILSDVSSLPEVGGEGSLYFPPTNHEMLCNQMFRMISEPGLRETLSAKALARSKEFSWNKAARQTIEALERLVVSKAS